METRKSFFTLKLSYCKEILIIKLLLKTPATRTHGTINMFLLMTLYCKEITKQDDSETTRYRIFYEATTFVVTRIQTHDLPIRVFSSAITSNAILCCSVLFEQKSQATKKAFAVDFVANSGRPEMRGAALAQRFTEERNNLTFRSRLWRRDISAISISSNEFDEAK